VTPQERDAYLFQERRAWFDDYRVREKIALCTCPCCGYPTLSERAAWEICDLCDWEDDGQDDSNARVVLGGPNQNYSLQEARDNFVKFGWMYRRPQYDEKAVVFVSDRVKFDLKQEMISNFEKMRDALPEDRNALWIEIQRHEGKAA
jgi:Cysteine-rich CPCC